MGATPTLCQLLVQGGTETESSESGPRWQAAHHGTELAALITPEASLERLVPLVDHLTAWKLLPNVSRWVPQTVERGYRIQFGSPPPQINGVIPTLVGPKQVGGSENHLSGCGVGFAHDADWYDTCSDRVDPHCSCEG